MNIESALPWRTIPDHGMPAATLVPGSGNGDAVRQSGPLLIETQRGYTVATFGYAGGDPSAGTFSDAATGDEVPCASIIAYCIITPSK